MSKPQRRVFTIAAPTAPGQRPSSNVVYVQKRFDQAKDERSEAQRRQDMSIQDFITHADFWIGIACFTCAFLLYFDHPTIRTGVYFVGLAGGLWLLILGVLTGMLYKTNQGIGIKSFLAPAGKPCQQAPVLPSDHGMPPDDGTRAAGFGGIVLLVWFVVEAILIIAGIYYTGWIQYVLGVIAFVWAAAGLIRGLGSMAVSNAMQARAQAMVAQQVKNGEVIAAIHKDPAQAKKAELKAAALAQKHRQLLILTVTDFSLSGLQLFSCVMMDQSYIWVGPVTFSAFLCTGFWMIILGKVTGHGDPGHHAHPMDNSEEEFAKSRAAQKSIAEQLAEVRSAREKGA